MTLFKHNQERAAKSHEKDILFKPLEGVQADMHSREIAKEEMDQVVGVDHH
jgi:hypothetical protein